MILTVEVTEEAFDLLNLQEVEQTRIAEVIQNSVIGGLMAEAMIRGVGIGLDISKAMKMKESLMVKVSWTTN